MQFVSKGTQKCKISLLKQRLIETFNCDIFVKFFPLQTLQSFAFSNLKICWNKQSNLGIC